MSIESGMLVTCHMQYAMSVVLPMCILISCSSVLCVLMALGMFMYVKVMSPLISVMSPPPCLCSLCMCKVVYWGILGV